MVEKILITCAWPYVHAAPHFGNLIPFLSADALARYHRLIGDDVEFVSGSDEHGARMEIEARKLGITPKQLVDQNHAFVQRVIKFLNFSFSNYSRTSAQEHREFSQAFHKKLYDNGYIKLEDEKLPYCAKCELFLPDKYVKGDCPHCGDKDIQGDQCDACGRVLDALDLINPRCHICNTKPLVKNTKTGYFDLPKFGPQLKSYISKQKHWQKRVINFSNRWIEDGLIPRPVTRDLEWGIPTPFPGMSDKVIYCWAEAVLGYLSAVSMLGRLDDFWKGNAKTYFCIGKDNIPFHTIILPGLLLGHGEYNLPYQIVNNEYLNFEGKKFSKSRGVGIYTDDMIDILSADYWRFYLYRVFPHNKDSDFSWKDFQDKINSELLANIGNFVSRVLSLCDKYFDGKVPDSELDEETMSKIKQKIKSYKDNFDHDKIREPLDEALAISAIGNEFLQRKEPWKNPDNKGCLKTCVVICRVLSVLLEPYLPDTASKLRELFTVKDISLLNMDALFETPEKVGAPLHLFSKLDVEKIKAEIEDRKNISAFKLLDLRVGKILEVKEHPKADMLYIEKIDLGGEEKQIVSGLKKYYLPEELIGKKVIVVNNLKSAELRGVVSEGMLLAAKKKDKLGVLFVDDANPGDQVILEGVESQSDGEITIDEFAKVSLLTKDGNIVYKDKFLKVGEEKVRVEKVSDDAKVS